MLRASSFLPFLAVTGAALFGVLGCAGSGSSSTTTSGTPSLAIQPKTVSLNAGGQASFTAVLSHTSGHVLWSLPGGASTGTIATDGTYTAPATTGTYTVKAALKENPAVTDTASVTVSAPVSVLITSPATNPVVIPRSKLTLGATVANTTNQGVDWTVNGASVLIDSNGTFTAPDQVGTYTAVARSKQDPTKTASRQIVVSANANVRVTWLNKGDVVFSLRPDKAPNTCANYVTLVNQGFYDGIFCHRYVSGFVVQWGDPLTKTLPLTDPSIGSGGPGYTINFEANDLLNVQYSLAMARSNGLNTAGSQVYVNLVDNASLDTQYCVFGAVASGTSVIDQLRVGDQIVTCKTEPVP